LLPPYFIRKYNGGSKLYTLNSKLITKKEP